MQQPILRASVLPIKRLLSLSDFTAKYGPCRTIIYRLLNTGALSAVKVGRSTFIPVEAAEAWLAKLPAYQPHSGTDADGCDERGSVDQVPEGQQMP